jgi:hypothetical protein
MNSGKSWYATDLKRLTMGECRRLGEGGWAKGAMLWALTRFMSPKGAERMPLPYDEMETTWDAFTDAARTSLGTVLEAFRGSGFRPIGYQKLTAEMNPNIIDCASVVHLAHDGRTIGVANWVLPKSPGSDQPKAPKFPLSVASIDKEGWIIGVTNDPVTLDPRPGAKGLFVSTSTPGPLIEALDRARARWPQPFVVFSTWAEVRSALEEHDLRTFVHRRDARKLFVPVPPPPALE